MGGLRAGAIVLALVLAMSIWSGRVAADAPALDAYGAAPAVDHVELSPSGDLIARVMVVGEKRALAVSRITTGESVFAASIGEAKVRDLRWIGEERILIITSQTHSLPLLGVPRSELFFGMMLELKTKDIVQVLRATPDVLATLYGGAVVRRTSQGDAVFARGVNVLTGQIDLHRINLSSGRGRSVSAMDRDTEDYVLNAEGEVIAESRYVERHGRWSLHLRDGWRLRQAWAVDAALDTPSLVGMGRSADTVIVSARRPDLSDTAESETGHVLFEVDVASGDWVRLPFERHPTRLIHHPRTGLLIGGSYQDEDGVGYEFLDAAAGRRWQAIARAFPGKAPQLISWTDALNLVVVFIDTGESGVYQLVDFDAGEANIVAEAYPTILAEQIGAVRPITYTAADGLEIPGYLTLPPGVETPTNLPLIVLAHGGPAARDVAGFDYWAQALASRGYAVLQPNFRGSSGYGRAFMEAGYGEWGRKMQTDLSDGVRWLAAEGVIDPARVCIVGGSYGGYAAMAGLTIDKEPYRCAVSVNGVSDLRRMVNRVANRQGERNSHAVRYWNRFMGAEKLNDRALDALSPAMLADQVEGPLLLIHGKNDTVVNIEQSRVMADAMRRAGKPVELVELESEDHWLSRPETRQRMLRETVRFLTVHNPVD